MADTARTITRKIEPAVTKAVKKLVLDIAADLAAATPVDTGWAWNNWIPSLDTPALTAAGSRGAIDPGPRQRGVAQVATAVDLFRMIYITNNVPYIGALNEGHSSQAPAGFVEEILNRRVNDFNRQQLL